MSGMTTPGSSDPNLTKQVANQVGPDLSPRYNGGTYALKQPPNMVSPKFAATALIQTKSHQDSMAPVLVDETTFDLKKQREKADNQTLINRDPLHSRLFTSITQTSTSIQVAWSHPQNFQKLLHSKNDDGSFVIQKQHIQYVLEYGIGVKVDEQEQFRQIYKGKAHKCIITDLMPRTIFRLRVAATLHLELELGNKM